MAITVTPNSPPEEKRNAWKRLPETDQNNIKALMENFDAKMIELTVTREKV